MVSTTCGSNMELQHTLALSNSGTLFGFGSNENGQLLADTEYVPHPRVMPLENVTDICAVEGGSLVVTGGDKLWSIGFSTTSDTSAPVLVNNSRRKFCRLLSVCGNWGAECEERSPDVAALLLDDCDGGLAHMGWKGSWARTDEKLLILRKRENSGSTTGLAPP